MDEGPTKGITLMLLLWACNISFDPGSAIFGQPASVNNPKFFPSIHTFKCFEVSIGSFSLSNIKS